MSLSSADRHAIAQSIVNGQAVRASNPPAATDFAEAIMTVQYNGVRRGASSIVITLSDPSWSLLTSGLLDPDADGRLDPVILNYPDGSRYWWMLSQVSSSGTERTLSLTFIPRLVWAMQRTWGSRKSNRASTTRAQFLQGLVLDSATNHGFPAEFYSRQLDIKQTVRKTSQASTKTHRDQADGEAHRTGGISDAQDNLTCNGKPLTAAQKKVVNIALGEAEKLGASTVVTEAMIYAAMGENDLSLDDTWQNGTSQDTATEAREWLLGGSGFQAGGGIQCAKDHPGYSVWEIANDVERNKVWNGDGGFPAGTDSYAVNAFNPAHGGVGQNKALAEAAAIVKAGGFNGDASGSYEVAQPYFFKVGTSSAPHESFWEAGQRLSQEVNWDLVIDGDRAYYDSDHTLIKAKAAADVRRGGEHVTDWSFDWESRNIATNFSLSLIGGKFDHLPADVVTVKDFGTATQGSTAHLPGRWLVDSVTRDFAALYSTLTLVQPTRAKKEPAPTVKTVSVSGSGVSSLKDVQSLPKGSVQRAFAAAQILSNMKIPYPEPDTHSPGSNAKASPPPLDCSASVSWVLYQAGMLDSADPFVASDFANGRWGALGKGRHMTVWASADHVFIEFYLPGHGHMQLNTSYSTAPGGRTNGDGPALLAWGQNGATDAASASFSPHHYVGP